MGAFAPSTSKRMRCARTVHGCADRAVRGLIASSRRANRGFARCGEHIESRLGQQGCQSGSQTSCWHNDAQLGRSDRFEANWGDGDEGLLLAEVV